MNADDLIGLYNELAKEDVLVEQIIVQHPRMVFGNASVNTIRTYTVLDKSNRATVMKAILRAGIGESIVDNFCHGGLIYEVDVATGIVCTGGISRYNVKSYVHPGTDTMMLGYRIPNWKDVLRVSVKAAELLPQVRIVGWDIAITESGVELIEGNHNPDYELLEFIGSGGYYEKMLNCLQS